MSTTGIALIALVMWSVILTFALVGVRLKAALGGGPAVNEFRADGSDLSGAGLRFTRAHANSLENLALPVGILLLAIATGNTAVTDGLAMAYVACRIGQSSIHIMSTAMPMVMLRATLFSAQMIILAIWGLKLAGVM